MKQIIYISLILSIISCSQPIKKFRIESDEKITYLKLYEDSTFIEEVSKLNDNYNYSGKWKGSLNEGESFLTFAEKLDGESIILKPEKMYDIKNGNVSMVRIYVDGLLQFLKKNSYEEVQKIIQNKKHGYRILKEFYSKTDLKIKD